MKNLLQGSTVYTLLVAVGNGAAAGANSQAVPQNVKQRYRVTRPFCWDCLTVLAAVVNLCELRAAK